VTTGSIDGNSCNIFAKDGGTSLGGYEAFVTFVPDLGCGVAVLSNQCIPAAPALSPPNSLPSVTAQKIICALHPDFKPPQPQ
jgi:beta-lactamase class C